MSICDSGHDAEGTTLGWLYFEPQPLEDFLQLLGCELQELRLDGDDGTSLFVTHFCGQNPGAHLGKSISMAHTIPTETFFGALG